MSGWIAAPLVAFLIFVAPLWLILHYRNKSKTSQGLSHDERAQLEVMTQKAHSLQERVDTLEKILDLQTPGWKK